MPTGGIGSLVGECIGGLNVRGALEHIRTKVAAVSGRQYPGNLRPGAHGLKLEREGEALPVTPNANAEAHFESQPHEHNPRKENLPSRFTMSGQPLAASHCSRRPRSRTRRP